VIANVHFIRTALFQLMKSEDSIHRSFCLAYAQAVLRYLREGLNSDVVFDVETQRFQAMPVAASIPPAHCE